MVEGGGCPTSCKKGGKLSGGNMSKGKMSREKYPDPIYHAFNLHDHIVELK